MSIEGSVKNFSFVVLGRILATALQAGFYLVLATLIEPEIYGEMSYFIALAGTFSLIARFGLTHTVVTYQAKNNKVASYQANTLALITSSVASLILIPINLYAALLCFAVSIFTLNQQNFLGLKQYKMFFWAGLLKGILIITLPIGLYFILDIFGVLLGMAISNLIASFKFNKQINRQLQSFSHLRRDIKVIIHNFGVESSLGLTRWIDKLLIVHAFGFVFAGLYQFNIQIIFGLSILPLALHSFLLSEESSGKTHKKIILFVLLSSIIISILGIFLTPYVIPQFFPKYVEAIASLQLLIFAIIPLSISAVLNAKLQAKASTAVGYSSLIRIVTLMVFLAIFGLLFELIGLSIAVLVSTICEMVVLLILYRNSKRKY